MALTLEDIARMSGVSRSTVSRVINEDPNVNEKTRQRVRDIIQNMNFQPNLAARSLAAGKTNVLGLVIPVGVHAIFTDPFFPLFIQGVSATCNATDYSVMLWLAEPEYERRTILQILYNGLVDGVIVASTLTDDAIVEHLAESKQPFVMIGQHPNMPNLNFVDVENRISSRNLVMYLFRLGYKRVAMITGPQNMIAGVHRYLGYEDAHREAGRAVDPDLVENGEFSDNSGYFAMKRLLGRKPDAVYAASDAMALGAMRAIQEAGLNIPKDIAVAGFDDIPAAAKANPPLTTIHQPILKSGMAAAEMLIDIIHHPEKQPCHRILPTELVIRQSCGGLIKRS
ncbi:MAG: LacI family DNA-binding transcriptional regulator [Anaerolineaceae bacterium]|nr:LacI family DNA-binding transcriptional regulator [Anaerolineaceae bacterium]